MTQEENRISEIMEIVQEGEDYGTRLFLDPNTGQLNMGNFSQDPDAIWVSAQKDLGFA